MITLIVSAIAVALVARRRGAAPGLIAASLAMAALDLQANLVQRANQGHVWSAPEPLVYVALCSVALLMSRLRARPPRRRPGARSLTSVDMPSPTATVQANAEQQLLAGPKPNGRPIVPRIEAPAVVVEIGVGSANTRPRRRPSSRHRAVAAGANSICSCALCQRHDIVQDVG